MAQTDNNRPAASVLEIAFAKGGADRSLAELADRLEARGAVIERIAPVSGADHKATAEAVGLALSLRGSGLSPGALAGLLSIWLHRPRNREVRMTLRSDKRGDHVELSCSGLSEADFSEVLTALRCRLDRPDA